MTTEPSRRRILRLASAWLVLPLACVARAAPPDKDALDLRRSGGEQGPPRDSGYGAPSGPVRPAPQDVRPPTPSPTVWPRPEPGWRLPQRRPSLPRRIPKPGITPLGR